MSKNVIRVVGAREHNLKNITVDIPRDKLVVITGLSGSGKSSLAFDTIFAEGQRRYVESLSAYARQFLGQMNKPDVDYIEGLSPAVSIDQKGASHNPRSTVGTVTEIYDYLRLLFARAGVPHCPECGREVTRQSAQEIVDKIEAMPGEARLLILSPLVRARKGTHQTVLEEIRKTGFVRARVDGRVYELDEDIQMDRYKIHTVEAVVDRLVIRHPEDEDQVQAARSRLTDSIETALKFGDGYMTVHWLNPTSEDADPFAGTGDNGNVDRKQEGKDILFSEHLACPEHGSVLTEIEPRTFSFNTPHGACPECQGLGGKLEIAADLLIPDSNLSLNQGAITVSEWSGPREEGGYYWQALEAVAREYDIDLAAPVRDLPAEKLNLVLNGTKGKSVTVHYRNRDGRQATFQTAFEGVIGNLQRRFRETNSEYIREKLSGYMSEQVCPTCKGARLRKEALHVTVGDANIIEVTRWHVLQTLEWVRRLCGPDTPLNSRQQ
ncbi:MAG: excinuclease ABC subunit UvrA, partial [Anaerolineales bacterium]